MRRILSLMIVAAVASVSSAAITDISVSNSPSDQGIVNRVAIAFDGQYTGSQIMVMLEQGTIFQQSPFGATGAPSDALIGAFPDLANDSFVTQGGSTVDSSQGAVGLGGGAVNLGGPAGAAWNADGLNQAWNPAPGVTILDQVDFMTAQVTLSPDAVGTWRYLGSADGKFGVISGRIGDEGDGGMNFSNGNDGQVNGGVMTIPEPGTISLMALCLLGLVGLRRRNG